jgi:hypothetical protein
MIPFLILNGVVLGLSSLALAGVDGEKPLFKAGLSATYFLLAAVSLAFAFTL